ncbi:EIF5, partial [Symbiodinium sp. KB8]
MALNIDGSDDPSYRYKMPRLASKTEGRGNGIKTNVLNVTDLAVALSRPANVIIKFFGIELGAQSKFDVEKTKGTVNGAHQTGDLQTLTHTFIQKFVLCPECNLPETQLTVKKSGQVWHKCSACGFKGPVVDLAHRLNTFIVKEAEASA